MIKSSVEKKWKASVQMETLFQSNNAVSFLLTNFIGFLPVGSAKWKALSYKSESEAVGGRINQSQLSFQVMNMDVLGVFAQESH